MNVKKQMFYNWGAQFLSVRGQHKLNSPQMMKNILGIFPLDYNHKTFIPCLTTGNFNGTVIVKP